MATHCHKCSVSSVVERFKKRRAYSIEINNSMYKCDHCEKEFTTIRGLNGHKGVHRTGGRYTTSRKKNLEVHHCKNCRTQFLHKNSTYNLYCSIQCKADFEYRTVSLPKLHAGEVASNSPTVGKYLRETFGEKCSICGLAQWMERSIPLDVDHIDGNPQNNFPSNLRLVCPNCHRQTDTWGNKATRRKLKSAGIHGRRTISKK